MSKPKPKILLVDDESFYIDVLVDLLKDDHKPVVAKNGEQALRQAASAPRPDLILLDVLMPPMNGYEVYGRLKANPATRDIPAVFLTVKSEVADELKGFDLGAEDYITTPMSPPIVRARVRTHLTLSQARRQLADQNRILEQMVRERTEELSHTKDVAIFCMASVAETRHAETGRHVLRTQHYVRILAEQLRDHPRFSHYLDDSTIELLFKTAPLHDTGKMGGPDNILLQPRSPGPDEWEQIKRHAQLGHDSLLRAEEELGTTEFLQLASEIVYTRHERWDGTGYPRALKGDDIPISGRLMALADVYDALISKRVYKEPLSHEASVEIIREASGTQFDPDVAEAFVQLQDELKRTSAKFADR